MSKAWEVLYDLRATSQYKFGFDSETSLKSWFYEYEWLVIMDKYGFRLQIYEIDDSKVVFGTAQIAFLAEAANLILTRKLI